MTWPAIRNGPDRFGLITRALHWTTAALVLTMLALGATIERMEVNLSNLWLFGLHKSLGLCVLVLILLRILWHRLSPPPAPLPADRAWKDWLARVTHRGFYLLLVLVPLAGWFGSSATGIDTVLFGRWTLPRIAPVSESWETAGFTAHSVLTKVLASLVLLHIAGALSRRDGTLRRMTLG